MVVTAFDQALRQQSLPALQREALGTVQINLTKRCNLACHHCHVESSPKRTEELSRSDAERIVTLLDASPGVECVDLTGGAPELAHTFRYLVAQARARGLRVIDRCNLTVLFEPGQEDTAEFLAANRVEVVASMPCYTKENVEAQRGKRVFDPSIRGLQKLNALGYGAADGELLLDLVYNPIGASLPPDPASLEQDYRRELGELFEIRFNRLIAIANMPIKRWADWLHRGGEYAGYIRLLEDSFNPETVANLMCRELISIAHDGSLYDCDFNQQLELPAPVPARTIWQLESFDELGAAAIATDTHCFGCTAGNGSSCGGALIQV